MADKSMSARDLAAKLHSANARVVTAYQHTSGHDAAMNLADASALIKEVISVLMEGETDYYGNNPVVNCPLFTQWPNHIPGMLEGCTC